MQNGFMNKIIGLVLVLVIGASLIGGLLAPILTGVQESIGDKITYSNNYQSANQKNYDYVDSLTLTAVASETEGVQYDYTINGTDITLISDYMLAVLSDSISIQIGTNGQFAWGSVDTSSTLNPTTYPAVSLTMADGEWELKSSDTTIESGTYSWVVSFVENGRYIAHNGSVVGGYCHGTPNDFIVYGSVYSSGELDTYYAYGNGQLTVGESKYNGTLNWNAALVEGTTDVYTVSTCSITITDGESSETYTPYRCLFLKDIEGHKSSGMYYTMFGVIVLLGIVSLVAIAANLVRSKY